MPNPKDKKEIRRLLKTLEHKKWCASQAKLSSMADVPDECDCPISEIRN